MLGERKGKEREGKWVGMNEPVLFRGFLCFLTASFCWVGGKGRDGGYVGYITKREWGNLMG